MKAVLRFIDRRDINALRLAVIAVVGIYLFFVAKYIIFIAHIFNLSPTENVVLQTMAISFAVFLLVPWLFEVGIRYSYFLVGLFFLSMLFSFTADGKIKLYLADKGGYFSKDDWNSEVQFDEYSGSERVQFSGYDFILPASTIQVTDSLGMGYFKADGMELRPKCFTVAEQGIVSIFENISMPISSENLIYKKCFRIDKFTGKVLYLCGIGFYESGYQRHRWFAQNNNAEKGLELDWILSGTQWIKKTVKVDMETSIMRSTFAGVMIPDIAATIGSVTHNDTKSQQESLFEKNCVIPTGWL